MITYANWLIEHGNASHVTQKVWPVIKIDLDYSARFWNYTGYVIYYPLPPHVHQAFRFDLWEEVSSSSFFTTAAQHKALRQGAALATKLGVTDAAATYTTQAANVLCFLQVSTSPFQ